MSEQGCRGDRSRRRNTRESHGWAGHAVAAAILFILKLSSSVLTVESKAATTAEPHPHQGKVKPYKPGMPDISLNKQQLSSLLDGELVQDLLKGETDADGKAGRALAVQDVHAPAEYVWDRILDFNSYNKMVPKVVESRNYETSTLRNGTEVMKTNMKLNVFGVKIDSYFYHTYFPSLSSMTWTLDYTKKSTLDDSVGFWYVGKPPAQDKQEDWSRVYYSVQVRIPSWIPGIVIGYLNKKAIREATTWVKRESEQKYNADLAAGRTLSGARQAGPGWGNAFKGMGSDKGGGNAPSAWMQKFRKSEPEPEPEPEPVIQAQAGRQQKAFRWARRSAMGLGGLCAGLALDSAIAGAPFGGSGGGSGGATGSD